MSSDQPSQPEQVDAAKARRSLRNGLITLVLALALVVGLLLAVPGLKGVATTVSNMKIQWVVVAVVLEVLSCASYIVAFLQVFERAPRRVGAQVALSEEAFGAAVSLGGVGSLAVGGWLMVERGAPTVRIAERSAVLFLYTSAINVITLILAGLGLALGLPGPSNPLLSIVPAAVGVVVLILFLLLPRRVERIVRQVRPGRLHTFLTETAGSVCDTKRLVFHPDWRIVGAIGYLWFDIAVLFACFAARPDAAAGPGGVGLPDQLPVELHPGAWRDRRARRQHDRHARPVRPGWDGGHSGHAHLPRDFPVGPRRLGHDRVHPAPEDQEAAGRPAQPARGTRVRANLPLASRASDL
jgi:hypothetical protein